MYQHTKQDKLELLEMGEIEKQKRLMLINIRKRDPQFIEYEHWIIVNNDYPYEGVKKHLVCRYKTTKNPPSDIARVWFGIIAKQYKNYKIIINPDKGMSCKSRFHFHLILD